MQDENKQDDSSVWSSYSDLFTNVAIIFLVMFVFALVKSGVTKIEQVQMKKRHENELKGKMSAKDVEKSKSRITKIEKTVEEMKNYESIIDNKVAELNNFAKKLHQNKDLLKEVIASQSRQDSLMKMAEEKLEIEKKQHYEKQVALEAAKLKIDMLNEEIEKAKVEVHQREDIVAKTRLEMNQKIDQMKQEVTKKQELTDQLINKKEQEAQQKIEALALNFEKTKTTAENVAIQKNNELKQKIDSLTTSLKSTQQEAAKLVSDLKMASTSKSQQDQTLSSMKSQLLDIEGQLAQNKAAKEKLESEKNQMSSVIAQMKTQNKGIREEYEDLRKSATGSETKNKQLSAENEDIKARLKGLENKLTASESEVSIWRGGLEKKIGEADRLKKELAETQNKFNNLAQTLSKLKDSVKNDVASKLMNKFKESGLNAKVDPRTGEVTLLSGEGFNFERGSAKISKEAKLMLKKIIPVYAEVLFEDEKIIKQISSFNMEGHSSPSFGGNYIAPEVPNPEAYSLNMRLSAQRAASVANFLMSKEIGDYPHKNQIKLLLQSVGHGYMKPVPKELSPSRLPASYGGQDCGPWDCSRSQRVQINFVLKDNMDEIHKIIDMNGKIK